MSKIYDSWKIPAERCSLWESCSIPVCPLDPSAGIRLAGEPECGSRREGVVVGLDPDQRWELGEGLPLHGLTTFEAEMVLAGEELLIGGASHRGLLRGWLPDLDENARILLERGLKPAPNGG